MVVFLTKYFPSNLEKETAYTPSVAAAAHHRIGANPGSGCASCSAMHPTVTRANSLVFRGEKVTAKGASQNDKIFEYIILLEQKLDEKM